MLTAFFIIIAKLGTLAASADKAQGTTSVWATTDRYDIFIKTIITLSLAVGVYVHLLYNRDKP